MYTAAGEHAHAYTRRRASLVCTEQAARKDLATLRTAVKQCAARTHAPGASDSSNEVKKEYSFLPLGHTRRQLEFKKAANVQRFVSYMDVFESGGLLEKLAHLKGIEEERVQLIGDLDVEDPFPLAATTAHRRQA